MSTGIVGEPDHLSSHLVEGGGFDRSRGPPKECLRSVGSRRVGAANGLA